MRGVRFILWVGFLAILPLLSKAETEYVSWTQKYKTPTAALLCADELSNDYELGLVVARGNVEVQQEGRILVADAITYNQSLNLVTASGNIHLIEPSGEIIFAHYLEVTGDLKTGVIKQIGIILSDESKFAASGGRLKGGVETTLSRAVYSPCKICKKNPKKAPLWQLKSRSIVWNNETHDVEYWDATLEMLGLPVLYMPYFSHPDPTVKRRTGFLAPTFAAASDLGLVLMTPYYVSIRPDKDLTVRPLLTTKGGVFMGGDYRQRFSKGSMELGGSLGQSDRFTDIVKRKRERQFRWHTDSHGKYDFTPHWRGSLDLVRASDQTYLRHYPYYGLSSESMLTSHGLAEGFYNRSYSSVQGYWFQGLRSGDRDSGTPLILPLGDIHYLSNPQSYGGRWSVDGNALVLSRRKGTDMRRVSVKGGWQVPYTTSMGDVYTFGASLRGDGYHITEASSRDMSKKKREMALGRVFPQAFVDWRYPFINQSLDNKVILEPTVGVIAAPKTGKDKKIPNEDSLILEPDDHSILSENRFSGLDRIDGGSRLNYGLKAQTDLKYIGDGEIFFGQSYALQRPGTKLAGTGLEKRFSDYIGRVRVHFDPYVDLYYRFRMDRENLSLSRNELLAVIGKPILQLSVDYLLLPKTVGEEEGRSGHQIGLGLSSQFTDHWRASIGAKRDLGKNGGILSQEAGLFYQDECFGMGMTLAKTFYDDRDLKPGTTFMFRFIFKNLGEFRQGGTIDSRRVNI